MAISNSLAERNHLVRIIEIKNAVDALKLAAFVSVISVPHLVVKYPEKKTLNLPFYKFDLNSSAIVFLDSAKTLFLFNQRTILRRTFENLNQIIVYCQKCAYEDLATLLSRIENPILSYEYFLIEEEKAIRLLTFVSFEPGKCFREELVEVNRFDQTTKKWRHGFFKIKKIQILVDVRLLSECPTMNQMSYWKISNQARL